MSLMFLSALVSEIVKLHRYRKKVYGLGEGVVRSVVSVLGAWLKGVGLYLGQASALCS